MEDAWQVQETDEAWLSKSAAQSKEQGRDDILCDEEAVWRVPDVGAGQDAEQGAGVSMHRLQYASSNESSLVMGDGFYGACANQ
jgi:hypothetical protein